MLKQELLDFLQNKLTQALAATEKLKAAENESNTESIQKVLASMSMMTNSLLSLKEQVESDTLSNEKLEALRIQLYQSFDMQLDSQESSDD